MQLRPILRGLKTYVATNPDRPGTGGSVSARYCYSVWLRHLILAAEAGCDSSPLSIAELGPGDSLGIGLAALLSGADHYHGLDVVRHARNETNATVFRELVGLFRERSTLAGPDEFPEVRPPLGSYAFPAHILTEERLAGCLHPERVRAIEAALDRLQDPRPFEPGTPALAYSVPWNDPKIVRPASVDMLFSQAVLEHVEDLANAYDAMERWLRPGAFMTHQIDFKSHGMTPAWNGHLEYPDWAWTLVKGRRSFLLNREPWSTHRAQIEAHGFDIRRVIVNERRDGLSRDRLAPVFRALSDEDATTAGAFVVAVRPRSGGRTG